jgi:hypothetical protein
MLRLPGFFLGLSLVLHAQPSPGVWRTDFSRRSVNLSEIKPGGPPKDGILALDRPQFDSVSQASSWLNAKEPVLVVQQAGQVRAYPLQILVWHELVNDQIGELPVLVSYCPLCNSAVVFDRRVNGRVLNFGVTGMLRESDMIMFDRSTESFWQQITGEAVVGALTGARLKIAKSVIVSFEDFAQAFPNGHCLTRETGYLRSYGTTPYAGYEFGNRLMAPVKLDRVRRVSALERIATVTSGTNSRAYPFAMLRRLGVVNDNLGGQHFVIFFQPGMVTPLDRNEIAHSRDVGTAAAYSAEVDGQRLSFRHKNGKITDKQTGSAWNVFGMSTEGPLAGKRLAPMDCGVYFAFAWLVFRPETEMFVEPEAISEQDSLTPHTRNQPLSGR